jgi:hypothetical protein
MKTFAADSPFESAAGLAVGRALRKTFSFPLFLGVLLLAGTFTTTRRNGVPAGRIFTEGDTWWHVVAGERILSTGSWPTADPYSFTVAGNPWIAYQWLGEVVMALAVRLGGLSGLAMLLVAMSVLLLLLLYEYSYLRSGNIKAAFVACALLLPVAGVFLTLRPQLLGYIFLLITLICAERFRQARPKALWILPGVFLLWANTHGTFPLGFMVLGLYWVSGLVTFRRAGLVAAAWTPNQRRELEVISLLCLLATLVTPYGTRLATYPLELMFLQPQVTTAITEWQGLDFARSYGQVFLALVLLFLAAQVVFPMTYRLQDIALLLFGIYESCVHVRFLFFFVLTFAPVLATLLARWLPDYKPAEDRYVLNAALSVLVIGGVLAFFPSNGKLKRLMARDFPQGAVEYLRQNPIPTGTFNEDTWGGYLIWSLGPEHKVFIDGRADIYDYSGVLSDYVAITSLDRNTLFLWRKYHVEACLLHRGAPLSTFLAALPDWRKVYADQISELFVRRRVAVAGDSGSKAGFAGLRSPGQDGARTLAGAQAARGGGDLQ